MKVVLAFVVAWLLAVVLAGCAMFEESVHLQASGCDDLQVDVGRASKESNAPVKVKPP